ncbi:radical SAM protein [Micromonospora echinofusca]|uniref:Radical SAM protein n=1 Tax=Micromonospora echinofusca TaxID=47858 RepID=A0A1C5GI54_MICEH|nr:radical SAM protein [Micromonospora echinofusca]SCG19468.1 hypothetical protein GA0070610_5843 [Micromonospora echinofusca]
MTAILESFEELRSLSRKWDVNEEDILLIALNKCGVKSRIPKPRMRIKLRLQTRSDEDIFLILSLGRIDSPFELTEDALYFRGSRIASIEALEDDDAVLGYFRNGTKVLTLNSNARSQCIGCAFCPNTMESASDPRLAALDDLDSYLAALVQDFGLPDMSGIDKVTICTGCFHYESLALKHLAEVREAMGRHGCTGYIHFLSSVLRSREAIEQVAAAGPFHLTTTVECFGRRPEVLKESKASLTPTDVIDILRECGRAGVLADYTYIVGLDPEDLAIKYLEQYAPHTTTFPRFQIFQPHSPFMDMYVTPGGQQMDYYLSMRKQIERLFHDSGLRPKPWENYRPLWYFTFADEQITGARI